MVFCGLIQSYPRIHPHSVLPLRFGKRSSTIWRNFLRSADVDIRSRFSANNPVFLYKSYTTWNRNNFSFSCPVTFQRRFNVNKLGLHSSSSLLHTETADAAKLKKDSEKHVEIHQSRTSNESSSHEDFKQHCETFQGQTQVDEILENLDMQIDNERLMNGAAADRHVVLAESSEDDFEGNSSDTGNVHSSSSQETVTLRPGKVMDFLVAFFEDKQVKKAALENGIGGRLFKQLFQEFKRKIVLQMKAGNSEMLRAFIKSYYSSDHPSKLFPLFLAFARKAHPMLNCINEVKKISDLRGPADLFPEARTIQRKIIYHAGPTNSGKTHCALERFRSAQSGVYCGPLRLLATEVFKRTNDAGIPCDLLTGEDRQWAVSPDEPADHIAATVEMCSTKKFYDCAVIDEIQMMNDGERGWAWTRALLGLPCPEIHICGENTAVDVVQRLVSSCNDEIEIHHYERLSPLQVRDNSLNGRVNRVKPGDCVVAFSQQELYRLRRDIEDKSEQKCAIIYGSLPPATKVEQASKFNDPMDECSVLVASDAIGMGLNLNIKRIVFSTLKKFNGQDLVELTPSQAKQIAGRAGRYGSDYPNGEALTFRKEDSDLFRSLMTRKAEDVKAAGLAPSTEQIEMLSQQLPDASLHKLYEVFESVVQLDGANYFMCDLEFKKKIAHKLRGIPLSIMEQYVFSTAPVSLKTIDFAAKFAVNVSCEMPLTSSGLQTLITWPPKVPKSLAQLQKLELLHEVLDLYLWLSHRFPEVFVDVEDVCQMQHRLEGVIGEAVSSGTLGVPAGQRPHPKTRFKNKIKFFKRYDFSV